MVRRVAIFAAVAAVACCVVAPAAADPDSQTPTPPPAPDAAAPDHGVPNGSVPPAPGPVGAGPQTVIDHSGVFAVGKDIVPGVYTSAGPLPGDACYWRRIGADNSTLENALSKQPQTVQIDPGDAAFKTKGCQPWQLTDDAALPNQNPPWLSQLQLRHNLDILNGLAGQSGNGQLPPY
jgi:hypothetical protein